MQLKENFSFAYYLLIACLSVILTLINFSTAFASRLIPAQMVYRIDLNTSIGDASDIDPGIMNFKIEKSCTHWLISSHLNLTTQNPSGDTNKISLSSTLQESLDGKHLEFQHDTKIDHRLLSSQKGYARLNDTGGYAEFEGIDHRVSLPSNTIFPTQWSLKILEALDQGNELQDGIIFDGTLPTALRATNLLLGSTPVPSQNITGDVTLVQESSIRIITSYFLLTHEDSEPLQSITYDTLPNGIITQMDINLGFATAVGQLVSVQTSPIPQCP